MEWKKKAYSLMNGVPTWDFENYQMEADIDYDKMMAELYPEENTSSSSWDSWGSGSPHPDMKFNFFEEDLDKSLLKKTQKMKTFVPQKHQKLFEKILIVIHKYPLKQLDDCRELTWGVEECDEKKFRQEIRSFSKLLLDAFFDEEKVKTTVVNARLYGNLKKSLMSKFKSKPKPSEYDWVYKKLREAFFEPSPNKVLKNLKKASPIKIKK
jgi:hypothetical protein